MFTDSYIDIHVSGLDFHILERFLGIFSSSIVGPSFPFFKLEWMNLSNSDNYYVNVRFSDNFIISFLVNVMSGLGFRSINSSPFSLTMSCFSNTFFVDFSIVHGFFFFGFLNRQLPPWWSTYHFLWQQLDHQHLLTLPTIPNPVVHL